MGLSTTFPTGTGSQRHQEYLINWLDQMVRYLEAIEAAARVLGREGRDVFC